MKMTDALHRLLAVLYPATGCALCGAPDALPLCRACAAKLHRARIDTPCPQCGRPTRGRLCSHCSRGHFFCTQGAAGLAYDETARAAVAAFKFSHRHDLTLPLAEELLQAAAVLPLGQIDLLVPVPDHPLRRLVRGYNPAGELARAVSQQTGIPVGEDVLRRRGFSLPSYRKRLNHMQRMRRAGRQFVLHRAPDPGTRVLLVDDVCTTGATLSACAVLLRGAGAGAVYSAVAAAVPLRGEAPQENEASHGQMPPPVV